MFQLPSALGFEKAGIRASGGRLLQHAAAAVESAGESRTDAAIIGDMWERVFNLYDTKGGTATDPILKARWDYVTSDSIDLVKVAWAMNGYVVEDSDWDGGELVRKVPTVRADGRRLRRGFLAGRGRTALGGHAAEQPVDVATAPTRVVWGSSPAGLHVAATCGCAATGRARTWRASRG
ncbi:MAG: hypothetical protein ACLUE1_03660 [Adlercreutzia equolifaciens]